MNDLACLALCVMFPLLVFAGKMEAQWFKWFLIWVTLVYFVSGFAWMGQRGKEKSASTA